MTAEQALAAAKIVRESAMDSKEWGLYPLAEALEEYAAADPCPKCGQPWPACQNQLIPIMVVI